MTQNDGAARERNEIQRLVVRYEEVYGRPPKVRHAAWLRKRIAWALEPGNQEGLSEPARRRLHELIAEIDIPGIVVGGAPIMRSEVPPREVGKPSPGTVLTRAWRDREIRVLVRDEGFECDGTIYASLSAVAKAVTGAHWNGRAFFNLPAAVKRRRA